MVIHIICNYKCIVFSRQFNELLAAQKRHCLAGGIAEGRNGIDDMVIELAPWANWLEFLQAISS